MVDQRWRPPALVSPPLRDVTGQPGQEALPTLRRDQLPVGIELLAGDVRSRRERPGQTGQHPVPVQYPRIQPLVGERLQEPLAVGELDQVHEHAPVGQHPVGHLDAPRPLELAGQELAPDGVPDVVGQEADPVETEVSAQLHGQVGLVDQSVRTVRFGGQSEPQVVEQDDPAVDSQGVDHPTEVERRGGEAVE